MVIRGKICILGDPGVGKTSLVLKFVKNQFPNEYKPTLGADFLQKIITNESLPELGENILELVIWDIAGQRSYEMDKMTDYYLQGSNGYILVYDVTEKESLKNLEKWNKKISQINGKIPFIVVGNKIDLVEEIIVQDSDLKSLIKRWKVPFFNSSAKTGEQVVNIFTEIARLLLVNPE